MSPWRWRLTVRRARIQAGLLAVVLLVSGIAATLVTTLYLLDYTTTAYAANEGMGSLAPSERVLVHTVTPAGTVASVIEGSERAAHAGLDPLVFGRSVAAEGSTQVVRYGEGRAYVVGYLGYDDDAAGKVAVIEGRWPEDATGSTEVIVPESLLTDLGLEVGGTLTLGDSTSDDGGPSVVIVGAYVATTTDAAAWSADRLAGAGFSPTVPVPNTSGLTSPAYGPFLTTLHGVDATTASRVQITYEPSFAGTTLAQITRVPVGLANAESVLSREVGQDASRVRALTPVAASAVQISSSVALTRSSVIVTGLLLLVVAVAALAQAAKLVAERRHVENHLMAARGLSGGQGFSIGALEALLLGVVTVAAAVPIARLAFLGLTRLPVLVDAGFHRDPGLPLGAWIAASSVGVLLTVLLAAPLVQRSHRLVEAEQTRARPARAGLQRAGIDLALLAVAAVAFWQLSAYDPPAAGSGTVPHLDPLLTAGPALALLAGALAVTRIVPAASRLLDVFASRGRRAVVPLAAWEVSRRPARAASAVMLLTLAISVGAFGLGYLATWTASQRDQALYLHPQDAVSTAAAAGWSSQREAVSAQGAGVNPVIVSTAEISAQSLTSLAITHDEFRGESAQLIATDAQGWASLEGGRLDESRGYALRAGLTTVPGESAAGAPLPDASQGVAFSITAMPSLEGLTDVIIGLRALVEDDAGELLTLDLGVVAADGKPHAVEASLEGAAGGVHLVGLQATMISTGEAPLQDSYFDDPKVSIDVTLADAVGLAPLPGWANQDVDAPELETPFGLDAVTSWTAEATGGVFRGATSSGGDLTMSVSSNVITLLSDPLTAVLTAAPRVDSVPLIASNPALARSTLEVGDDATLRVASTTVRAELVNTVPLVAGNPGAVVAVDLESLQLALFQRGGSTEPITEWWVSTDDAEAYAAEVASGVTVTTRDAQVATLTTDPLRISIPTAVWLVVGAAALLAAIGFAVHVVVSTRARELELAQLSAAGLGRGQRVRMLTWETALLAGLGSMCGLGLGAGLVTLIAPLIAIGPSGQAPLPDVNVVVPWLALGGFAAEIALVCLVSLAIVAVMIRRVDAATLLRTGQAR